MADFTLLFLRHLLVALENLNCRSDVAHTAVGLVIEACDSKVVGVSELLGTIWRRKAVFEVL